MIALKILGCVLAIIVGVFLLLCLITIAASFLAAPGRTYEKDSRFYRFLLNFWIAFAMWAGRIHIQTSGLSCVPKTGPFLLVGNHLSAFDPIIALHVLRDRKLSFISKEENFHVPFFGRIMRKCCFLPIDRQDPREAIHTVNQAADLLRRHEVSMGVYPEGTRNTTNEPLLPFHNGVIRIARKADVPILVVTAQGTHDIQHNFPFKKSRVSLHFLALIPTEKIRTTNTADLCQEIRTLMEKDLRSDMQR